MYRCLNAFLFSGAGTAVKETIQFTEFIILVHLVASATKSEQNRRVFFRVLFVGLGVISIAAAVWHISNGMYASYKELGAPKYAFAFFALLAVVSYLRNRTSKKGWIVVLALILTVLSGERKGWVALFGAGAIIYFVLQGRSMTRLIAGFLHPKFLIGGGAIAAIVLGVALQFEYVAGQFRSFYDLYVIASEISLQMDFSRFDTSGSNLARLYILLFAVRTTLAHPLFGVGTGRWHEALAQAAGAEGPLYSIGAHSEYQRFAVENGLTGLALYITSWIFAARRAIYAFRSCTSSAKEDTLAILGIVVFGAVINLFLGGGAFNIIYLALATGLLVGLDNDKESLPR
jgi:hypothetical protein